MSEQQNCNCTFCLRFKEIVNNASYVPNRQPKQEVPKKMYFQNYKNQENEEQKEVEEVEEVEENQNKEEAPHQQQQNQYNQANDEGDVLQWIQHQENLLKVKTKKKVDQLFMKQFVTNYDTNDNSLPDISFHFKADGSQAIIFSAFCEISILQKAVLKRNDIKKIYYDEDTFTVLLVINPKLDLNGFDQKNQEFQSNEIPLEVFISSKFEQQKKLLTKLGLECKSQIRKFGLIQNPRLRADLVELFECLDDDLEFSNYSNCRDHCFAYYTQTDDLNQIEGLIIGPQDTPYEGLPYTVTIQIPEDYPSKPPKVTFNQQILHPNISEEGEVCLNILQDKWNIVLTIQKVLVSIVSLLYEKDLDDVYNHYAKTLYKEDPEEYRNLIRKQSILQNSQNLKINFKQLNEKQSMSSNNYCYSDQVQYYDEGQDEDYYNYDDD